VICLSTVIRFLAVIGINYLITISFVTVAYSTLGGALIGKIISLPFVAVNGFLLSKYWVFVTTQPFTKSVKLKRSFIMKKRTDLTKLSDDGLIIIAMQGLIENLNQQIKQQAEEVEKLRAQLSKDSHNLNKLPTKNDSSISAKNRLRKQKNTGRQKIK
jgi:putative flippase GtrA